MMPSAAANLKQESWNRKESSCCYDTVKVQSNPSPNNKTCQGLNNVFNMFLFIKARINRRWTLFLSSLYFRLQMFCLNLNLYACFLPWDSCIDVLGSTVELHKVTFVLFCVIHLYTWYTSCVFQLWVFVCVTRLSRVLLDLKSHLMNVRTDVFLF